jgi:hypothetical protein
MQGISSRALPNTLISAENDQWSFWDHRGEGIDVFRQERQSGNDHAVALKQSDGIWNWLLAQTPGNPELFGNSFSFLRGGLGINGQVRGHVVGRQLHSALDQANQFSKKNRVCCGPLSIHLRRTPQTPEKGLIRGHRQKRPSGDREEADGHSEAQRYLSEAGGPRLRSAVLKLTDGRSRKANAFRKLRTL